METPRQRRKNGHKDFKKKMEKSSWKHEDKQGKQGPKDTEKKKEKGLWKQQDKQGKREIKH